MEDQIKRITTEEYRHQSISSIVLDKDHMQENCKEKEVQTIRVESETRQANMSPLLQTLL